MSNEISLLYWVQGDDVKHISLVDVKLSDTVYHLKKAIQFQTASLRNTSAIYLEPRKFGISLEGAFDNDSAHQIKLEEGLELKAWKTISSYWKEGPPKSTLSIVVARPADAGLVSRKDRLANPAYNVPVSHPFVELWSCSWKSDTYISSDVHVPSTCWVLDSNKWMRAPDGTSHVSGILARDEYREALHAVVDHYKTGETDFSTTVDGDGEMTMEVDKPNQPFANPFLDLPGSFVSNRVGFILMGHPGIGKTTWLMVVLVLRLLAGLPTILQSRPDRLYYFNEGGVRQIEYTSSTDGFDFRTAFAPSTWCLVDTNLHLQTVPSFIRNLRLFIVQASLPDAQQVRWHIKQSHLILFYYLKPWSLSELITGRTLQWKAESELALETFYNRFGPSARSVYAYASNPSRYERSIWVPCLTSKALLGIITQAVFLDLTHPASDQILLIEPSSERCDFNVTIPTRYIYEKLRNALSGQTLEGAASMFDIFNRSSRLKGVGYMLEDAIRCTFPNGGEWKAIRLEVSPPGKRNTHWRLPDPEAIPRYLRIGYQGGISFADNPLPGCAKFDALPVRQYKLGATIALRDGYYCPANDSETTLGSFAYESATNTANILQTSVSLTPGVQLKGFEWLQRLGVKNFRYIYVAASKEDVDLPFPNELTGVDIPEKYCLVVTHFPGT